LKKLQRNKNLFGDLTMLEAIRDSIEELTEAEQGHYEERDGRFYLVVGSVDGVALEDVQGLKTTVETLRATERKLKSSLERIEQKFEDIDPEEARNAIKKFDEVKNWDGDTKIREAQEAVKRELVKQHTKQVEELQDELSDTQTQLTDAIVNTKIVEALQAEEGNVELLLPHVKRHVRMVKNSAGKWMPEVTNEANEPRVGDSDGNPMTIVQYIQEMKSQKTFAAAFPGANATGSGVSGSSESGKLKRTDGSKTIAASDGRAMSASIDDIATGKTKVDMNR